MFKNLLLVGALLSTSLYATAPQMSCGMARTDLKVCFISYFTPEGESSSSLKLTYASGDESRFPVTLKQNAEGQGVSWYWGTGKLKGRSLDLWLRVDFTPTFLPVVPGNPPVAKLYYRANAQSKWQLAPNTGEFKLNLPE